jgi:hypothetical protein
MISFIKVNEEQIKGSVESSTLSSAKVSSTSRQKVFHEKIETAFCVAERRDTKIVVSQ